MGSGAQIAGAGKSPTLLSASAAFGGGSGKENGEKRRGAQGVLSWSTLRSKQASWLGAGKADHWCAGAALFTPYMFEGGQFHFSSRPKEKRRGDSRLGVLACTGELFASRFRQLIVYP